MRVVYDKKRDTLTVLLKERARVAGSDEDKPGNVLDYDASGDLISLAILDALRRVTDARKVDFSRDERPETSIGRACSALGNQSGHAFLESCRTRRIPPQRDVANHTLPVHEHELWNPPDVVALPGRVGCRPGFLNGNRPD